LCLAVRLPDGGAADPGGAGGQDDRAEPGGGDGGGGAGRAEEAAARVRGAAQRREGGAAAAGGAGAAAARGEAPAHEAGRGRAQAREGDGREAGGQGVRQELPGRPRALRVQQPARERLLLRPGAARPGDRLHALGHGEHPGGAGRLQRGPPPPRQPDTRLRGQARRPVQGHRRVLQGHGGRRRHVRARAEQQQRAAR